MGLDVDLVLDSGEGVKRPSRIVVHTSAITHNLTDMAQWAGIYEVCWKPEEVGATRARNIISVLEEGLVYLIRNQYEAQVYEAENGWGTYKDFVRWVTEYLFACRDNPEAWIEVDR